MPPEAPLHYPLSALDEAKPGSSRSAEVVVPVVRELLAPGSVLDAGCGLGTWLQVWQQNGVQDILGVDGTDDLPPGTRLISTDHFRAIDLRAPFNLGRRFALVQSLEVAEHLPRACAAGFVQSLCDHGDMVLFGAAIPGQGGHRHVNEQWQSHWARLFAERGFKAFDVIRPRIWHQPDVSMWYKQNTLLFAHESRVAALSARLSAVPAEPRSLDLVHPDLFTAKMSQPASWVDPAQLPVRALLAGLGRAIPRAVAGRLGRSASKKQNPGNDAAPPTTRPTVGPPPPA